MAAGPNCDRGRIEILTLSKSITFNGNSITEVKIEIDHINHGLNDQGKLNAKKRTNFTVKDIEKFIRLLDKEDIAADSYQGRISNFSIRINCPIKDKFFDKIFIMIFDTDYNKANMLHTITLIPGWK